MTKARNTRKSILPKPYSRVIARCNDLPMSKEDKVLRKKLRNRQSALAARERKKARIMMLERQVRDLEQEQRSLKQENFEIKQHIYGHQETIYSHHIDHGVYQLPICQKMQRGGRSHEWRTRGSQPLSQSTANASGNLGSQSSGVVTNEPVTTQSAPSLESECGEKKLHPSGSQSDEYMAEYPPILLHRREMTRQRDTGACEAHNVQCSYEGNSISLNVPSPPSTGQPSQAATTLYQQRPLQCAPTTPCHHNVFYEDTPIVAVDNTVYGPTQYQHCYGPDNGVDAFGHHQCEDDYGYYPCPAYEGLAADYCNQDGCYSTAPTDVNSASTGYGSYNNEVDGLLMFSCLCGNEHKMSSTPCVLIRDEN